MATLTPYPDLDHVEPDDRIELHVSDTDDALVMGMRRRPGERVTVTDLDTGDLVVIEPAPCGRDCYCGAAIVARSLA